MISPYTKRPLSTLIFFGCGIWLIGLGIYFIGFRPALLAEDLRFMKTSLSQLQSSLPGLEKWLKKVFTVMGGFILGAGVFTVFMASIMAKRLKGMFWVIALSGIFTVGLMCGINFILQSDFKLILTIPAVAWLLTLILYIKGR